MVNRHEFIEALRMLVARATWLDRWRARNRQGHWLSRAQHEIAMYSFQPDLSRIVEFEPGRWRDLPEGFRFTHDRWFAH